MTKAPIPVEHVMDSEGRQPEFEGHRPEKHQHPISKLQRSSKTQNPTFERSGRSGLERLLHPFNGLGKMPLPIFREPLADLEEGHGTLVASCTRQRRVGEAADHVQIHF